MSNLTSANFTAGALTIETTEGTNSATNIVATSAQYAGFRVSSLATNSTITVGNTGTNPGRSYRLINADSTYTLTFKATGQTGITLQPGQSAVVAFNGTDYVFVGVALNAAQTFTATQTVRAAPTQDGVALAGRAGGTSSYAVTITPTTLSTNRTLTIPDASGTILQSGTTVTVAQGGTGATTLTANNVILGNGTSAVQFVAPGTSGNVLTSNGTTWASTAPTSVGATVTAVATGTLSSGAPVLVNSDGTVSVVQANTGSAVVFESANTDVISAVYDANSQKVVIAYSDAGNSSYGTAIVGTVSGTSISFGTAVVFESASTSHISTAYNTNAQKVVIAYRDGGNSGYGTAIVGTVSGTSISFGTAAVFESADTRNTSTAYDANSQKVVIAYQDAGNSYYGTAIVGTVSGTSISFGTAVVFESANTTDISAVYDANSQKVVIGYSDNGNSFYGTAIVGTVSGTSISFGTAVVFESATTSYVSAVYDTTSQKVVIAYRDGGNSGYGTAIVGTVSGTSISFGTAVVFESASTLFISAVYDTTGQKVVIAYRDGGNSDYGTAIVGTVSGTSISFGNASVFEIASTYPISAAYDANSQKVAIAYRDLGNSNYGTAIVFDPTLTPLTSNNFIGFSSQNYTTGQSAKINIISNTQSGLTLSTGQGYYLLPDGTLSLTPSVPSVYAGVALSATTLLIKG
jgi:hypothetical protein